MVTKTKQSSNMASAYQASKISYRRDSGLQLVSSASTLAYNNVAVSECGRFIAIIHQGLVNVISTHDFWPSRYIAVVPRRSRPRSVTSTVFAVKFISISFANSSDDDSTGVAASLDVLVHPPICLVIASSCGLQIYEPYGAKAQFGCKFEFSDPSTSLAVLPQMGMVCAGDSQGYLRLYSLARPPDPPLELVDRIKKHNCEIHCLETLGDDMIASGDQSGIVLIWRIERGHGLCLLGKLDIKTEMPEPPPADNGASSSDEVLTLKNDPFPCTGVVSYKGLLLSSFGSGYLVLYDLIKLNKLAEVAAHVAWITGLDIATETGFAVSVSEDSWLQIWHLNPKSDEKIIHAFSISIEDRLLVGVRFLNSQGSNICTAAYDDVYCHLLALES